MYVKYWTFFLNFFKSLIITGSKDPDRDVIQNLRIRIRIQETN